ncbi:MAG TPA: thioredoxin domain-containing protein [bacterium]|nr:thioredoxin domain-containing protein [bacterium]
MTTPSPAAPGTPRHTNRLSGEKSPYLLQHAHNPVDWYPWGPEAFAKAQAEDKLVLVSIGYATCHWCHVMERESFENEALAGYLNQHYVAIKVDREERPDVDKIYMDALMAMGQQGGWPLNVFCTPDGRPVVGGTYFPPEDRQGRRGLRQVLEVLQDVWAHQRQDIFKNAETLTAHLRQHAERVSAADQAWDRAPLEAAVALYRRAYDRAHGGFALQPQHKFPPSMGLMLLLRHHARTGDADALGMVEHTLQAMVSGGIYDQLGGGISRYSTDYQWLVPHFEKMLYDNALLAQALTEAHLVTGKPLYRAYAEDVLGYVSRDMTSPEGAFTSAEDADSEGEEGKFYVWTPAQMQALLPEPEARAALAYWAVTPQGNFEHGTTILAAPRPLPQVARELGLTDDALAELLDSARETLFQARCQRVRPLRDDKVLTSWNALMISAFARAGRAFGAPEHVARAERAARFVLERLRDGTGRLLRRYREGEARFPAYLVDHASLAVACLDLYEASGQAEWFDHALRLMREVNRLFRNEAGPYYDTGSDAEPLLARTMEGYDGVEPSGNSSAALAFLRLHAYGVREGFDADARRIFAGFAQHLGQAGVSFAAMLSALDLALGPAQEVAIVGDPAQAETQALLRALAGRFLPRAVLAQSAPDQVAGLGARIPLLASRTAVGGRPTAYVCQDMACRLPVHTPEALLEQLKK